MRWLLAMLVVAGCSKADEPKSTVEPPPPAIAASEVKRGLDACKAYLANVCACSTTVPAAKEACSLAASLPEAIEVGERLVVNPRSAREDAVQAAGSIRKTVKKCIEETAKLPSLGCP
jgi:hypothetical protein